MRLDQLLVARGHCESRARARALIEAGAVRVDGAIARRPAQAPPPSADISVDADPNPWVSRGGLKLAHALDAFSLDPAGARALDLGASTGGFTDVLIARGARAVAAVDVGHGQLAARLADDPRVTSIEGVNARDLSPAALPFTPDWVVADLSFIALEKALRPGLALAADGATLVALVKPQFELGRARVGKGGVVRDPDGVRDAVAAVSAFLEAIGWRVRGDVESPVLGGDGNREALLWAERS